MLLRREPQSIGTSGIQARLFEKGPDEIDGSFTPFTKCKTPLIPTMREYQWPLSSWFESGQLATGRGAKEAFAVKTQALQYAAIELCSIAYRSEIDNVLHVPFQRILERLNF